LYLGVDLGGTTIAAGLVDEHGGVIEYRQSPTETEDANDLLRQLTGVVHDLLGTPALCERVRAIGAGLPGLVNQQTQQVVVLPNLPDLSAVDLVAEFRNITDLPVVFDNDASAAAYGEYLCGAGRGARSMFSISIGTGIGSGLVLDGKLYHGASGYAGEFGHVTILAENGIECACGNVGCLETMCSIPNIVRRARERLFRDRTSSLSKLLIPRDREFTADDIVKAALAGDDMALLIMERTAMFLGIAVAGVINLLNVETVVIGGSIVAAGDALLQPLIAHTRSRAFPPTFEACRIVASELGPRAGLIGAALLARDEAR
jgi:glucokinase